MKSPLPQLLVTNLAPRATAVFSAVPRSAARGGVASARRVLHRGETAEAMSRASGVSPAQPGSGAGRGPGRAAWRRVRRHPVAGPRGGGRGGRGGGGGPGTRGRRAGGDGRKHDQEPAGRPGEQRKRTMILTRGVGEFGHETGHQEPQASTADAGEAGEASG